jgi:hypothetical protein
MTPIYRWVFDAESKVGIYHTKKFQNKEAYNNGEFRFYMLKICPTQANTT